MRLRIMAGWVFAVALAAASTVGEFSAQDRSAENSARDRRMLEARARLAKLLAAEGVDGRFFERIPGSYVFAPKRIDLPQAPVSNPEVVAAFAVGPLLHVRGTLDGRGLITVTGVGLVRQFIPEGDPVSPGGRGGTPPMPAPPPEVVAASKSLRTVLESALKPGAVSVTTRSMDDTSTISAETRTSLSSIRTAYREAVKGGDQQKILTIVREWAQLRTTVADFFPDSQDHKALYGPPDNYEPWRYDVIFRQSRAVIAIGEVGGVPPARCSGVLIAPDLVLTAAHCFGGRDPKPPNELEVWFDYARGQDGTVPQFLRRRVVELIAPSPARLADMNDGAFDSQLLDYAILRFAAPVGQPLSPTGATPQCLRARPLPRSAPVYVVGYPRGEPIMVHDSARVYLPYRIRTGDEFVDLRINVDADLLGAPERVAFMEEFDRSYATIRQDGVLTFRYFHHVRDNEQPRMGIVADTFRGNSGGPVYDRENTQCVVGILIAGAPDTGERLTVNWKQHERVLPVSAVLEDAERHVPGIRTTLNVEQQ
jgi:hypothetical protein